jgi:hypothetical protein
LYEGNFDRASYLSSHMIDNKTVEGILGFYNGVYFVIKFDQKIKSIKVWNGKSIVEGKTLDKINNGG